ncbi:MAG: DUF448 domain-containing protein [Fimbriimonadaceae bacterium]|nr:DUF448 domain-containing protein [Fimbriimonadaceae bacterium]QOJ12917.1 MAG: YlxR family protein [Chthonomonadaceae bacterium]
MARLRTCVGCGQRLQQDDLQRIKCVEDRPQIVGARTSLPGRSAYVCPSEGCVRAAGKGRRLQRTLRREFKRGDVEGLIEELLCKLR